MRRPLSEPATPILRRTSATTALPPRRGATVRYRRSQPRALSLALYSAFAGGVASFVLPASLAWANPQGQQVVRGSATFNTNGNTLTVTNTPGAAINWQSFSIKANETTHFQQANSASSVLNRVIQNNPSELLGKLTSNGKVVLVNPFGITVGKGAAVDTAGFTASTLNISDADWAQGKLRFQGNSLSGDVKVDGVIRSANGDVMLFAPNVTVGSDALVKADNGNVVIGAGQKVEVTGRGLEGIRFEIQSADNKAVNLGKIEGNAVGIFAGTLRHSGSITAQTATLEGGRVVLRAIKDVEVSGPGAIIRADGAAGKAGGQISISSASGDVKIGTGAVITANGGAGAAGGSVGVSADAGRLLVEQGTHVSADGFPGGSVRLFGATEARVAGVVTAASPVRTDSSTQIEPISLAKGGKVQVLGEQVSLQAGAQVDVSGDGGGGTILIGGDFQGKNPEVPNAKNTDVAPGVILTADGRVEGDGGRVIVWADNDTHFAGTLSAQGGLLGGNGGFAETSGKHNLYYRGRANLGAPRGRTGTLLLDPDTIAIFGGTADGNDLPDGSSLTIDSGGLGTIAIGSLPSFFTVYESELENTNANILLQAASRIFVTGTFGGGDIALLNNNSLTMEVTSASSTNHGIDLTSSNHGANLVIRTSGSGGITLSASGASPNGSITLASLATGGGSVKVSAAGTLVNAGGITVGGSGSVSLSSSGAMSSGSISTVGGDVELKAKDGGALSINGLIITAGGDVRAHGAEVLMQSGASSGNINASAGDVEIEATGTIGRAQVDYGLSITGGSVSIAANRIWIDTSAGSITGFSQVELKPYSAGRSINVGAGDDTSNTGYLGISAAEVGRIQTPLLRIGATGLTGDIDITSAVSLPTAGGTLALATGGNITQAVLNPISAGSLVLRGADIFMQSQNLATTFAGEASSGGLYYRSSGSFVLGAVDGLATTSARGGSLTLLTAVTGTTINLSANLATDGGAILLSADHVVLGIGAVAIDTQNGTLGSGGSLTFGGDLSAPGIGRKLFIDTSAVGAGYSGGNVNLGNVGNFSGNYLNLLGINAQAGSGGTDGTVTLGGGTLSLAAAGTTPSAQATLNIGHAFVRLLADTTIDTNVTGSTLASYGGLIDLSNTTVGSDSNHRALTLRANNGAGGLGGTVKLGTVGSFGTYGSDVGALTVNALGSEGSIHLYGDITTDGWSTGSATGNITLDSYEGLLLHAPATTLRTSGSAAVATAGSVSISSVGTLGIAANAVGAALTIDTSPVASLGSVAGNITLNTAVGNGNGTANYLQSLSLLATTSSGTSQGTVKLQNDILLDRGSPVTGAEAALVIDADKLQFTRLGGTTTIDTLQSFIGAGGSVSITAPFINTSSGTTIRIDTSTSDNFSGRTGGDITIDGRISALGATTGAAPGGVLLDSSGVALNDNGLIHLSGDILVANSGTIGIKGATVLDASVTLGSASGTGPVNVTLSRFVDGDYNYFSKKTLTIDGGSTGAIDLSGATLGSGHSPGSDALGAVSLQGGAIQLGAIHTYHAIGATGQSVTANGTLASVAGGAITLSGSNSVTVASGVRISSIGSDGAETNGEQGGNIVIASSGGKVQIGANAEIFSQGGYGSSEFASGGDSTAGGDGGTIQISAKTTLSVGPGARIYSQGGEGGSGISITGSGSNGGEGGWGGGVSLTVATGQLSIDSGVTIGSYGGQGGYGAAGGAGFTPTNYGDPGGNGYDGGHGGDGGVGGSVYLSALTANVMGTLASRGGLGGSGGSGGQGGDGGPGLLGDPAVYGGMGGTGGTGGAGGQGANGGSVTVALGSGTINAVALSTAGSGGFGGFGGAGGQGGLGGPVPGIPGDSGVSGVSGAGSFVGDISISSAGTLNLAGGQLSGRGVSVIAGGNLDLNASVTAHDGDIVLVASSGGRLAIGNFVSIQSLGSAGVADQGSDAGNITLLSTGGALVIGDNVNIQSTGGQGADRSLVDGYAYGGGRGGDVSLRGATVTIGAGLNVLSQGGRGGDGLATNGNGTSGGFGGDGGNISITTTSGALVIPADAVITSLGGTGGNGSAGAAGEPGQGLLDGGDGGYGGNGGSGGYGGTIVLSGATGLELRGTVLSKGGQGGNGGDGGIGGAGGDGSFESPSGSGGAGGDAGYNGSGGEGGYISIASSGGTVVISGASVSSRGGMSGIDGVGGSGGPAGTDFGGGSGDPGADGYTSSGGSYEARSGSIRVLSGAATIDDSHIQGSFVSISSSAGAVTLDTGADIVATDGAFILAEGGQLLMDAAASIQVTGLYYENTASLASDTGIQLSSVRAPTMVVDAPTVSGAPGYLGIHLDGGTARFGRYQLSGVYGTYGNYGSSGDKLRVHLTAGSATGDLRAYVDRELWVDVTGDVTLGDVLAYTTGATGNIHLHGNGSIHVVSGIVGSDLGDNVGVFLGTSSGTITVGSNGDISASGNGTIQLATLDGGIQVDGYLFSDSGHVTLSAPTGALTLGGFIHSNSGRFELTGDSITITGEVTGNYTGTGPGVVAITDDFRILSGGTLNAGSTGTIALLTQTTGKAIEVQTISAELALGVANIFVEDIDRMQAHTLQIGDINKTAAYVKLATDVNPSASGAPRTWVLAANGDVSQAIYTGASLDAVAALSNGAVLLNNLGNDFGTVAGAAGGLFHAVSSYGLTVGTVAGITGIAGGTGVELRAYDGNLNIDGAVDAGAGADGAAVRLTASNAVYVSAPVSGKRLGDASIVIKADDFYATATLSARGGSIALNPASYGRDLKLGGVYDPSSFNISTGSLSQLAQYDTLFLGSEDFGQQFGNITVDSHFSVGAANLSLSAQGGVQANGSYGITANALRVRGGWVSLMGDNAIGAGGLAGSASTESGSFALRNLGDLWIAADGIRSVDGNIQLTAAGGGSIRNTAESGGNEHLLQADAGDIQLAADTGVGSVSSRIYLTAGNTVSVNAGSGDVWLEGPRSDLDPALRIGSIVTAGGNTSTVNVLSGSGITLVGASAGNDNWHLMATGASGNIDFTSTGGIDGGIVSLEADANITAATPLSGVSIKATGLLSMSGQSIGADGSPIRVDIASGVSAGTGTGGVYLRTAGDASLTDFNIAVPTGATISLISGGVFTVNDNFTTTTWMTLGSTGSGLVFNRSGGGSVSNGGYALTLEGPVSSVSDFYFGAGVSHAGSWSIDTGRTSFGAYSELGTLSVATGATLALAGSGVTIQSGNFVAQNGTLDLGSGNTLNVGGGGMHNAGTLTGSGSLGLGGSTLVNSGTIQPGTDGTVGTIAIGGSLQQNSTGVLYLDWTAGGMDHLSLSGNFASGGTVSVGETGAPFLLASDQASAVYFQGSYSGSLPAVVSRSAGVVFGGVFTAGAAGHLMISPSSITNLWVKDSNAAELWSVGANWSRGHAPTLGESVVVNVSNNPVITITGGSYGVGGLDLHEKLVLASSGTLELGANGMTVYAGGALSLTGGVLTGAGNLSIENGATLQWSGGQMQGSGWVSAQAGAVTTIQSGSGQTLSRTFYNDGLFDAGSVLYLDNATLANTGTVVLRGIGDVLTGTGTLSNQSGGTLATGTGSGSPAVVRAALSSVGEIQVAVADLVLTQGSMGGYTTIDTGRTLTLQDSFAGANGSISNGGGTLRLAPAYGTTLSFAGAYAEPLAGTVSVGGSGAVSIDTYTGTGHLVQDSGTITGAGDIAAVSFSRSGGDIGGSGTLTTTGTAVSSGGNLIGRDWLVQGSLKLTGGYLNLDGSTMTIDAAGLLDFQSSYMNGSLWSLAGSGTLVNNGTVRNSFRSANATDRLAFNLANISNNGLIEFGADGVDPVRNLSIEGSVTHGAGGTLSIAAGKQVSLAGSGTQSFASGSRLVNAGTLQTAGGTVDVAGTYSGAGKVAVGGGSTLTFNTGSAVSLPVLTLDGSLGGNDAVTVASVASLGGTILGGTGVFKIASTATATSSTGFTVVDRTLRNDGTLALIGGTVMLEGIMQLQNAGTIHHSGTATLQDQFSDAGPATLSNLSGGIYNYSATEFNGIEPLFVNAAGATFNVTSGQAVMAGGITQSGTIQVASGATLAMGPGITLVNSAGGVIAGTGTIDVSGTRLLNNGIVRPGGQGTVGTLNITGEFNMGTGTVEADFASAVSFDKIAVTGGLVSGGTISVSENAPFIGGGSSFPLITATLGQTGTLPTVSSLVPDVTFVSTVSGGTLSVAAATVTNRWATDAGGSWFSAGNWSRGHVPNALESAVIDRPSGTATVTVGSAGAQALSLQVLGDETLQINGASGSLSLGTLGGSLSHLVMTGGTLAGGPVTLTGTGLFSGASMVQSNFSAANATVTESGLGVYFSGGGSFTNSNLTLSGSGAFFTGGTFTFTDSSIDATGNFFAVSGNAQVTLAGTSTLGSVSLELSGAGTARLTLDNTAGANSVASFSMSAAGGTLDGAAPLEVTGDFIWNGGTMAGTGSTRLNNASGSSAIVLGSTLTLNRTLLNQGSLSVYGNGALTFGTAGTLHNDAGATLALAPGGSALFTSVTGAPLLLNDGVIRYDASSAPSETSSMGITFQNNSGAELYIDAGRLNLTGTLATAPNAGLIHLVDALSVLGTSNRDLVNTSTGVISGFGTIAVGSGTLTNNGNISPGDATTIGTLTVAGNYAQGFTGDLYVRASGPTSSDRLAVTGVATLDGILEVDEFGHTVGNGNSYTPLTAASTVGSFAMISFLPGGVTLTPVYGAGVTLNASGGAANVWIGTDGDWDDAANWSLGHAPISGDVVIIDPSGGAYTVTIHSAAASLTSFTLSSSGMDDTLLFKSGSSLTLPPLSTLAGTLSIAGGVLTNPNAGQSAGTVVLSSGSVVNNGSMSIDVLNLSGGHFGGSGSVNLPGSFVWTGGTLAAGGGVTSSGTAALSGGSHVLGGAGWTLTAGTASWTGGNIEISGAGSTLAVGSGATFDVLVADAIGTDLFGSGTFDAQAGSVLNLNAVTGSNSLYANQVLLAGTVNLLQGELDFDRQAAGSTIALSGTLNMSNGTRVKGYSTLGGPAVTFALDAGAQINVVSGTATLDLNNWSLDVNTALTLPTGLVVSQSGGTLQAADNLTVGGPYTLSGGTLTGSGNVILANAFNWGGGVVDLSGTLSSSGTSTLGNTVQLAGTQWDNSGSIHIGSGTMLQLSAGAQLNNLAAGTLNVANAGATGIGAGPGGGSVSNAGVLQLGNSTIATGGGDLSNAGSFTGTGLLDLAGTGTFSNTGVLSVGGVGGTGTLAVSGHANLAGGTLNVDLAGPTTYDKLTVTGNLVQGGTVSVSETTAFVGGGSGFVLVSYGGTLSGATPTLVDSVADVGFTLFDSGGALNLAAATVTNTWANGVSGNWATAANWSRGHVPNALEDALVNPTGVQTVTLSSGAQTPRSLQLTGDDTLLLTGGTLSLGQASTVGSAASLVLSGGVLGGAGAFDVAGAFNWNGGTITAGALNVAGVLTIGNASLKELSGTLSHSNGSGASSWIGGNNATGGVIDIIGGGRFINQAGARLTIATGGQFNRMGGYGFSPVGYFDNYGQIDVTGGGTFAISPSNYLNQAHQLRNFATGVITVTDAALYMDNDAAAPQAQLGTWNFVGSSGTASLSLYGSNVWDASSTVTTSGATALYNNGSTTLASANAQTWSTLQAASGNLAFNQNLTVTSQLSWGASLTASGGAALTLAPGASGTVTSAAASLAGGNLVNKGNLAVGSGKASVGQSVSNIGTLSLSGGTLTASAGLANSGLVTGSGTVATSGTFANTGFVKPGGTGSIGTLTVQGNADLSGGTVFTELAGTGSYDRLAVTGNLTQGGTLSVSENTLFIAGGDVFDVVTYGGSLTGTAATIAGPGPDVLLTLLAGAGKLRLVAASVINHWADGVSGDWATGSNWTRGHAPNALEDAYINPTGVQTVTLSAGAQAPRSLQLTGDDVLLMTGGTLSLGQASTVGSAASLLLSGGEITGAGALDIAGNFSWNGGSVTGAGTLATTGASTLGGASHTLGRSWNNTGTVSWSAGSLTLHADLTNKAGGVFNLNLANPSDVLDGTGTLANQGGATIHVGGTAFTSALATIVNDGAVVVDSGSLDLYQGATHNGSFIISSGADMRLGGSGTHNFASGGAIGGAGHFALLADGPTANILGDFTPASFGVDNGTLSFAGSGVHAVGVANLNGGSLQLGGTLSAGTLAIAPGSSAVARIGGSGTLDTSLLVIDTSGTTTGYAAIASGVTVNATRGTFDGQAGRSGNDLVLDGALRTDGSAGQFFIVSNARIGGSGTLGVGSAGSLNLAGGSVVDVTLVQDAGGWLDFSAGGTVRLGGGGTQLNGLVRALTGSQVTLSAPGLTQASGGNFYSSGTVSIEGGASFSGGLSVDAGAIRLDGPAVSFQGTSSLFVDPAAVLDAVSGTHQIAGSLALPGTLHVASGARVDLAGAASNTHFSTTSTGTLAIDAGGTLALVSGGTLGTASGTVASVSGAGTLLVAGGALQAASDVGVGVLRVTSGAVTATGAHLLIGTLDLSGGSVTGNGDMTVTQTFSQSNGTLGTGFANLSITQQSGNLAVGSLGAVQTVTLAASTGSITDANGSGLNVSSGLVKLSAASGIDLDLQTPALDARLTGMGTVAVRNSGPLELVALSAPAGGVTLSTTGAITQSGAIQVMGPMTLATGGAAVTLTDPANQFDGTITLVGVGAAQIVDTNGLSIEGGAASLSAQSHDVSIGALSISGPLTIVATGQISQGAALTVGGLTSLSAADILLGATASSYGGGVSFDASGQVSLASSGALVLAGTSSHAGGALTLTALGPVSQTAPVSVGGAASVTALGQSVDFGTQANDFASLSFDAASVAVRDLSGIVVNGTASGLVAVLAASDVSSASLTAGSLSVTLGGTGSAYMLGTSVSGAASFATTGPGSYQNISYSNATTSTGASVGGSLLASGTVDLQFKNVALVLPAITAATVTVGAGGNLTQSGPVQASHSSFTAVGADVQLTHAANQLGALSVFAASATVLDAGTVDLAGTVSGVLSVSAGGIAQAAGRTLATGSANLMAGGDISLTGANTLGTLAANSGGALSVIDDGASLVLGQLTATGALGVQSAGALTALPGSTLSGASAALVAQSIGTAAQPVLLATPQAQLYAFAGDVHARSAQPLALTGLAASGDAVVTAAGAMQVTGEVSVDGTLRLSAQGMSVGTDVYGGSVTLDAGAGNLSVGGSGAAGVFAANAVRLIGNDITLLGGSQTGASTEVFAEGSGVVIDAAGNFVLRGGTAKDAYALVSSTGAVSITSGGAMSIHGGSGDGAYANVEAGALAQLRVTAASVTLQGGSAPGAYAGIVTEGDITVAAASITLTGGSKPDADAVVVSYFGKATLPSCNGCVKLSAPPLGNGQIDVGVLGGEDYLAILTESLAPSSDLVLFTQVLEILSDNASDRRRQRRGDEIVVEGQGGSCVP
jgi:filamentous hemagglutinin family protein